MRRRSLFAVVAGVFAGLPFPLKSKEAFAPEIADKGASAFPTTSDAFEYYVDYGKCVASEQRLPEHGKAVHKIVYVRNYNRTGRPMVAELRPEPSFFAGAWWLRRATVEEALDMMNNYGVNFGMWSPLGEYAEMVRP